MRNRKGFTLVEIMIVVAIVALLAAIAIPNLLRAKISANEALAQSTLRAISTAAETYASSNNGDYPADMDALTDGDVPYMETDYCAEGETFSGYTYDCTDMADDGYTVVATPSDIGTSGENEYTITTGGVLTVAAAEEEEE